MVWDNQRSEKSIRRAIESKDENTKSATTGKCLAPRPDNQEIFREVRDPTHIIAFNVEMVLYE